MSAALLESGSAADLATGERDRLEHAMQRVQSALHDIGQPLTSIALAMELLLLEEDVAVRESMLTAARKECSRAMNDVTELRRYTVDLLRQAETTRGVEA